MSDTAPDLYLSGLSYELGELRPLREVRALQDSPTLLEQFTTQGLEAFSIIEADTLPELVIASIDETLTEAEAYPADIDAVLITTSTLWGEVNSLYRSIVHHFGFTNAYPYGVALSECANAIATIQIASGLAARGRLRQALVVVVDRIDEAFRSRIVPPNASIYSDTITTFLLDVEPREYRVGHIHTVSNNRVWSMDPRTPDYLRAIVNGIKNAYRETLDQAGLAAGDLDRVLINNYSTTFVQLFRMATGCSPDRLFTDNIRRYAHSYAGDGFINLADLAARGEAPTTALVLTAGIGTWATATLHRSAP